MSPDDSITDRFDAVIVAGGRGRRIGGVDKGALLVDGERLLDRALDAVRPARTVVVGPPRSALPRGVLTAREKPPFAGPAAAVAAGLDALGARGTANGTAPSVPPWTAVLAVDLVRPRSALEALLAVATTDAAPVDGWVARDPEGHRQPLLAVYQTVALRAAVTAARREPGGLVDASVGALLAPLRLQEVPLSAALCADVDDPADLRRARTAGVGAAPIGGAR